MNSFCKAVYLIQVFILFQISLFQSIFFHPCLTFFSNTLLSYLLYCIWENILFHEDVTTMTLTKERKTYISTNIVKSNYLMSLVPLCFFLLTDFDNQKLSFIRNLGAIYASVDCAALKYNKNMSINTIIHHLAVVAFFFVNLYDNYEVPASVSKMIMIYAIYSTFAYLVNYCLAIRFFYEPSLFLYVICFASYAGFCCINWYQQLVFIYQYINYFHVKVYSSVLVAVMYDDISLLRWFYGKIIKKLKT